MKLSLFTVALCISLAACNKQPQTAAPEKMVELHQRISAARNPYLQKAYYRTLSAAEKADLWRVHISQTAAGLVLNAVQKAVVNEAYSLLTEANFGNNDALRKSNQFIIWQQKMFEAFSEPVAYRLFAAMNGANASTASAPDYVAALANCECASKSDWCNFGTNGSNFYCKTGNCGIVLSDCGTFWSYDCNGGCAFKNT